MKKLKSELRTSKISIRDLTATKNAIEEDLENSHTDIYEFSYIKEDGTVHFISNLDVDLNEVFTDDIL